MRREFLAKLFETLALFAVKGNARGRQSTTDAIRESTVHTLSKQRPYSRKELCTLYRVSNKTFKKWIIPFSEYISRPEQKRIFTIAEVEIIFEKLGSPFGDERIG